VCTPKFFLHNFFYMHFLPQLTTVALASSNLQESMECWLFLHLDECSHSDIRSQVYQDQIYSHPSIKMTQGSLQRAAHVLLYQAQLNSDTEPRQPSWQRGMSACCTPPAWAPHSPSKAALLEPPESSATVAYCCLHSNEHTPERPVKEAQENP
jgi:hypothetical protein